MQKQFSELDVGECFASNGHIFLKVTNNKIKDAWPVYNINSQGCEWVRNGEWVEVVEGKVVFNKSEA